MAFLALGDVVAAALLQTGRFRHADAVYVWAILAGSAIGLLASTLGRLYASTYYALRDTRTPLRYAVVRVALTTALGYVCAIPLPRLLGIPAEWGAAGLTASAGIAGWIEMLLLRRALNARIGRTGLSADYVIKLWAAAACGAIVAWVDEAVDTGPAPGVRRGHRPGAVRPRVLGLLAGVANSRSADGDRTAPPVCVAAALPARAPGSNRRRVRDQSAFRLHVARGDWGGGEWKYLGRILHLPSPYGPIPNPYAIRKSKLL